jgi:hypothetical protein
VVAGQRKKRCLAIAFTVMLLSSAALTALFVNLAKANPYLYSKVVSPPVDVKPPAISVDTTTNNTLYSSNKLSLALNVSIPEPTAKYSLHLHTIQYQTDWKDRVIRVYTDPTGSGPMITDFSDTLILEDVPDGSHNVTFVASVDGGYAEGLTWYAFAVKSVSSVYFSVDTTSPEISVLSLENMTCEVSDVPLNFTVSEVVIEVSYCLDGQGNVTVAGNTTLSGLPVGVHNVTVYAWDEAGNVGASKTTTFTIAEPEQEPEPEPKLFPTVPVAAASAAVVASVSAGILVYFKKRKH